MIDDPATVARLMEQLQAHLPIPAHPTPELARLLRERGLRVRTERVLSIVRVYYLGDEGGICCDVTPPGDEKRPLIVSLTHLLLGFLSSRVLGQYDTGPLLSKGEINGPGKVFFLDGNIAAAAGRIGVPLDGLRLWIVLHEMTHALQFEGYPWLRRHLGDLLENLIGPLSEKLGVAETVRRLSTNLKTGARSMELVMSPEQRQSFDKMQAAMSVIEGYSDFVMHNVGKGLVPHYEHLKDRMARSRAHRPPLETAVFRLTGMDVKLEQYRLGERFADAVASRQGMGGLNRVWEGPENLPTLAEVRDPGLWMTRMDGV